MLRVHLAFGLAPHMGQRTDNFCRSVSFPAFTPALFDIGTLVDGQICSLNFRMAPKRDDCWNWISIPMADKANTLPDSPDGSDFKVRRDHPFLLASKHVNAMRQRAH